MPTNKHKFLLQTFTEITSMKLMTNTKQNTDGTAGNKVVTRCCSRDAKSHAREMENPSRRMENASEAIESNFGMSSSTTAQSMMSILAPVAVLREAPKCTLLALIKFSSCQVFTPLTHNCIVERERERECARDRTSGALPFIILLMQLSAAVHLLRVIMRTKA